MIRIPVAVSIAILTSAGCLFGQDYKPSITLLRGDYEVGVSYKGEAIAKEVFDCLASSIEQSVRWKDDSEDEVLTSNAKQNNGYYNGPANPSGFDVYAGNHVYTRVENHAVTLIVKESCKYYGKNPVIKSYDFPVTVWGRVPVRSCLPLSLSVKRSTTATLTVKLYAPAPPSNTRVVIEVPSSIFTPP